MNTVSQLEIKDEFRGDNTHLRECIRAIIEMSDEGIMIPHGLGGHARNLLAASYCRLESFNAGVIQTKADMPAKLFQWSFGRQGSGYRILPLWRGLGCDGYIIHIPAGVAIAPHKDKVEGRRHFRLNVDLKGRCWMEVGRVIWKFWRFTLFRPDLEVHEVPASAEDVWMWSVGWIRKENNGFRRS